MIIDTTVSTADKHINLQALRELASKKQRFSPGGVYSSRKEQLEFRDLYVREFLETHGLDADIDLRSTVVFWENDEISAVFSKENFSALINDRDLNVLGKFKSVRWATQKHISRDHLS